MLCFALLCFSLFCFALLCFALLWRTLRNMLSCHVLSFALLCFTLLRIAWHCFALLILCRFNCHHHPWSCTELRSESDNSVHKPGQGWDMKTHHGYWYKHFEHSNKQLEGSCHATPLIINFWLSHAAASRGELTFASLYGGAHESRSSVRWV